MLKDGVASGYGYGETGLVADQAARATCLMPTTIGKADG